MRPQDAPASNLERRVVRANITPDDRVFMVYAGGECFGIPVSCVQTVFRIDQMTPIPLAHPAIVGLINLRGRIVTSLSLRRRLGMDTDKAREILAIGIEHRGEAVALVVDEAGDVITLPEEGRIAMPRHMPPARAHLTHSVYRLEQGMISILDMASVFDLSRGLHMAA